MHTDTELQVYAVWIDVLFGDDRSAWNPDLLVDPRVIQYWDGDRTLGTWFPRQEEYKPVIFGPLAWDIFFLYGPEAARLSRSGIAYVVVSLSFSCAPPTARGWATPSPIHDHPLSEFQ